MLKTEFTDIPRSRQCHVTRINKYGSRGFTASESVSQTSSPHDSTESTEQQEIRNGGRRRRGVRGRESSRRSRGRESSRRGRGRVIRQRRGRGYQESSSLRRTEVVTAVEARDGQLKERIASMSHERKDDLLSQICQKHPNMVFAILNGSSTDKQGYHPSPGGESPSWCICSNCREMPTDEERKCCQHIPSNCYSRLPDFDLVVLDEVVLLVAQRYREDVLVAEEDNNYNRGKRHAAYRQFILWSYGYLGAGNRRVIPSCCVWRIRDKYPDSFGQYHGFTQGRLG